MTATIEMTGEIDVMMTCDAVGGVWTYSLDLIEALSRIGRRCALVILGPAPTPQQWQQLDECAVAVVRHLPIPLEWMNDPWDAIDRSAASLLDLERAIAPAVVHINGYSLASLPWTAPCVVVAHSDVVSWWRAVHRSAVPDAWSEYERRVVQGLRCAAAVVAPTAAVLDDLSLSFGSSGGIVIHNGRDPRWVTDAAKEPLILTAGRLWDQAKNVVLVDRVAAAVPWPVIRAGDETSPSAGTKGSTSSVESLGLLSFRELSDLMSRASIFVAPAKYEPFGLGSLEAGMCGCALVLGDITSLREVWGDAATYVDPDDPDDLTGALHRLIDDPELLDATGRRCRDRAALYTADAMAAGYAELYATLSRDLTTVGGSS